jgi:hypothetical protein
MGVSRLFTEIGKDVDRMNESLRQAVTTAEAAGSKLTSAGRSIVAAFDAALNPSKALGEQIRLLEVAGKSSAEIWKVYQVRATDAATATTKLGQAVDPTVQKLIEQNKAVETNKISFESLGKVLTDFARNPLQTVQNGITGLLEKLGPMAVGIGAAATAVGIAGTAMFKFVSAAADQAEQFENLSTQTGLSVQQLGALKQIAVEAGLESLDLGRTIGKLNEQLGDPKANEFTDAMTRMGISTKTASGQSKDAITVLDEMRIALLAIEDKTQRAQMAQQVLGGRMRELIPLLLNSSQGIADTTAEMEKQGVVVDDLTQQKLLAFDQKMDDVSRSLAEGKTKLTEIAAAFFDLGETIAQANPNLNAFGAMIAAAVGGSTGLGVYNALVGNTTKEVRELTNAEKDIWNQMIMMRGVWDAQARDQKKGADEAKKLADELNRLKAAQSNAIARSYVTMQGDMNRVLADGSKVADAMNERFLNLHDDGIAKLLATIAPNGPMNSYFDGLGRNARAELDAMNKAAGSSADALIKSAAAGAQGKTLEIEAEMKSWTDGIELNRRAYEKMISSISDGAGEIFDAIVSGGKDAFRNLGDWLEATFLTRLRAMFQGFMSWLFGGMKGGFGGVLEAIGAGGNGSLFSKGMGVLGFGSMFGGTAVAATGVGAGVGAGAVGFGVGGGAVGFGLGGEIAGSGTVAGGGGTMASIGALASNPITIAAAGAVAAYVLYKAFKAHDPVTAGAMEVVRDFKVKIGKDTVKQIYDSLGLSEDQAKGIRKDITSSPIVLQQLGVLAQQQGTYDEFLTSLEKIETAWGTFDFRAAFELGNTTGDWSELNKQFEDAFEHSQELQNILPNWREQLDALNDSTKMLTTTLTAFRDAILESITPIQSMYDEFLATGELTDELAAKITSLGGSLESFYQLAEQNKQLQGLQTQLDFIKSLASALKSLAPELDPINQILAGNIGNEAMSALLAAGLDPAKFSNLVTAIGAQNSWGSGVEPFSKMTTALRDALLTYGGSAGATAVSRYGEGFNTITQDLLDTTKAAMDAAYQDAIKEALGYLAEKQQETVDQMTVLIEAINATKIDIVAVLDDILAALTSGSSSVSSSNQQLNPDYTQWQADYQYAQGNTEDIDKWARENPAPPIYIPKAGMASAGQSQTIVIQGDVYGYDDFVSRVAQAGIDARRMGYATI